MPDLDDVNKLQRIIDRVENPIGTHSDPEESILAGELLGSMGPRFTPEGMHALDQPLTILLLVHRFEFLCGARFDEDPIVCHAASEP